MSAAPTLARAARPAEPGGSVTAWIQAGVLFVLAFVSGLFPIGHLYLWDEAVFLSDAENLLVAQPYYSDSSYRAPLLPLLLHLGSRLMPLEIWAHVLAAGCFGLSVVVFFFLGHRLYGRLPGLLAAGLMLMSPFFVHQAHKVMADILATTLALASLYFLFRDSEEAEVGPWSAGLAGFLLGAGMLAHFAVILLCAPAVYLFALHRLGARSASWYTGGFFAALAPYLAWSQFRYGNFLKPFFAILGGGEAAAGRAYYLEATYIIAGPVTLVGLGCYLYAARDTWRDWVRRDAALILTYGIFLLYLSLGHYREVRYALPAVPPLFLLAGRGLASLKGKRFIGPAVAAVSLAVLYPLSQQAYFSGRMDLGEDVLLERSDETRTAALYLQQYLPSEQVVYSSSLYPLLAYYSKKKTMALWPWDESFYSTYPKNMAQAGYLVYYKNVAKEPKQEWLDGRPEFRKVREYENIVIYSYRPAPERLETNPGEGGNRVGPVSPAGAQDSQ